MVSAALLLALRAVAAAPIAAALTLLVLTPANVAAMVGGTVFLVTYLYGWQRLETGAIPLARIVAPLLFAVGATALAILLALLATIDDPGLALVIALTGMAAAVAALALAIRPAR